MADVICVPCQLRMKAHRTGQAVESMTTDGPYKLHEGDVYKCPSCGHEVLTGMGTPIAEHWQPNYIEERLSLDKGRRGPLLRFWYTFGEKHQYDSANEKTQEGTHGR